MVASRSIAKAIPKPIIFTEVTSDEIKAPKTKAKIAAAAVIIRPDLCNPRATADSVLIP